MCHVPVSVTFQWRTSRKDWKGLPVHAFNLSLKDVLLGSPDLFSEEQTSLRLEELDRAASPLAMLSDMDLNDDTFAQKDVTIWAGDATDSEPLLDRYRKLNATTTIRASYD